MKKVVFIDGVRTPFLKSGTDYMDLMSYQLGQFAIKGLVDKTGIDVNEIDRVIYGNVISICISCLNVEFKMSGIFPDLILIVLSFSPFVVFKVLVLEKS